jgi:MFS family permease
MFVLGATLKKFGWRTTMIVGILGHAARFAVYAFFPQSAAADHPRPVLHGICYAFFFATVYIFVDAYFPKDIRSSAQGLFNLQILGIGALLANSICPWLMQERLHQGQHRRLQGPVPRPLRHRLRGRDRPRLVLPPADLRPRPSPLHRLRAALSS